MESKDDLFDYVMNIVNCILGADNKKRIWGEEQLALLRSQNPEQLFLVLIKLIETDYSIQYRKFTAILIKNYVSTTSSITEKSVWNELSLEVQDQIKAQLLANLEKEVDPGMARTLAYTIAELDSTLQDFDQEWPEICELTDRLLKTTENITIKKGVGYILLTQILPHISFYYEERIPELMECFKFTLNTDPIPIKLACIETICTSFYLLENVNVEEHYIELLVSITGYIECCLKDKDEASLTKVIESLSALSETEPKLLRMNFGNLFDCCVSIAINPNNYENDKLREMSLELLLEIFYRAPLQTLKGIHSPESYLEETFKAIFYVTRHLATEIDESWVQPKNVFDSEDDSSSFGRQAVDRLLNCTKIEIGLNILGSILIAYFSNSEDWRCHYAALMGVSQVGAYIRNAAGLSVLVPVVLNHITLTSNPKVTFAALFCLEQLSKDCDEEFHEVYHSKVMPVLISGLDATIPRVQQQTCFTLKAFIEKLTKDRILPYIDILMEKISKIVTQDTVIKESGILVIGPIANAAPEIFYEKYYNQVMSFLLELLKSCNEEKHKIFRKSLIECIVLVQKSLPNTKESTYLKSIIEVFWQIQEHELDEEGILRSTLLSAWQSICIKCKDSLIVFTETIVPSLIKLCKSVPGISTPEINILQACSMVDEKEYNLKSKPEELEKEDAVSLASLLLDTFGVDLGKYLDGCAEVFLSVLKHSSQESLKQTAAISLKNVLMIAKEIKDSSLAPIIKLYVETLLKAAQNENATDNIETEVRIALDILLISNTNSMNQKELIDLLKYIMEILSNSNKRKLANNSVKDLETLDDTDMKILTSDNDKEDALQITVAHLLQGILKTHKNEATIFANIFYPDLIDEMLTTGSALIQKEFALILCVAMIENLTYSRIPSIYPSLCDLVIMHSNGACPRVRKVALYGIGVMTFTASEYFKKIAENSYWALKQALEAPIPAKVNRKEWKEAQDNAVSAFGKLIFYQGKQYVDNMDELIGYWLTKLPLKKDCKEGKIQCELLAELLELNWIMIAGTNGENLKEIIRILCDVINSDQLSLESANKVSKGLHQLGLIAEYCTKINQIIESLPSQQKTNLKSIFR